MFQIEYKIIDSVWYAMKASYGKALKAKALLDLMHIENYIPMRYEKKKIAGRNKIISIPVISNLIFIKCDLSQLNEIKRDIIFLHNMLNKGDEGNVLEPIIIPDMAMRRFMTVVSDAGENVKYVDAEINRQIISSGTRVRIKGGKYEGYEGVLCRPKGSRAKKVLIDLCGIAPVEIQAVDIELLKEI